MDNITYPDKISVIYMDSIPLFAIVFKLLSPILPQTFQYFGLWGILCFMLQGGIGALITKKFSNDNLICCLSSLLFVVSPVMIRRMFGHTALAGHWIILLAIYIWLNRKYFDTLLKKVVVWSVLMAVASTVHLYFIPMIIIIMIGYLIQEYLENKSVIKILIIFLTPILFSLVTLFILGAFSTSVKAEAGGLGHFSTNLNSVANPQGWSKYLKDLKSATSGQYEGFAYLGLGIIALSFTSIYISINKIKKNKTLFNNNYISIIIVVMLTYLLAVSHVVTLGENTLFTIRYPNFIMRLLSSFRSTGRFIWVVCYLVIIFGIRNLVIDGSKRTVIIILIICNIIQVSDIYSVLIDKNRKFDTVVEYNSSLKSNAWDILSEKGYKNIVIMDSKIVSNLSDLWALSKYAADNNMTINDCYIARKDSEFINNTKLDYIKELENGNVRDKTIYLFYITSSTLKQEYPLNCYYIDNFVVGINEKLDGVQEYDYIAQQLNNEIDIYTYLDKLSNLNYITVISGKDEFSGKLDNKILEKLKNLGFKSDLKGKYRWSYLGIVNSNSVEYEELKDGRIDFNKQIDDLKIETVSAGMASGNISNIKINGAEYSLNHRGLNIVVYDKRIKSVIDSVSFDTHGDLKAYR